MGGAGAILMAKNAKTKQFVYIFIKKYVREHTHPPSIREIGEGCYLSNSVVIRYLDQLENEGKLIREPGRARGITLVDEE
jgi:SOS-response transcriptional repressor LexA